MNPEERYQSCKKVTLVTLIVNLLLSVAKVAIGILFFSQAIIADGIHSISDVISTLAVWVAIRISRQPADDEHPYGHGTVETIAAKFIGIILFLTGLIIIKESIMTIVKGNIREPGILNFWIAFISILAKEWMYRYTYQQGKSLNNKALMADAYHHRSDALSSIAALIGVVGAKSGYLIADPIAGLIVALFIIHMGYEIFMEAIDDLMNKVDDELYQQIREVVSTQAEVIAIRDLRIRNHGPDLFVDLRIVINDELSVVEGHSISREVESRIKRELDIVEEILIHIDPLSVHKKLSL
ncbi:cation diffusion facilitator family transporter [Orenia marismortui]|uniref:Cation diffusion facilitator family transporter n=1 Tax=Orenia marismortui TaxID=46469 RepID=A0A4V3GYG5_9FIRM|nr:cation diffusion facilitator family transporter [Orenia marismortui]TDX52374.1 cation diffusion facilitator family transporter [Orenia marismortui]